MKTLLLLHGAIGSAQQLSPLEKELEKWYDVHVLNFPGHGGEEPAVEFSIPAFAEHVKEYCITKKLHRVAFFGYSMGGYVAMYLAGKEPSLVEAIATLATKFHWTEDIAAREIKMLQPDVIAQKLPQFAEQLERRHAPLNWKDVLANTAAMLKGLGEKKLLGPEVYPQIKARCLLMLGDRDKMVSMEETLAVYHQLPNAQLAVLPGTPHQLEQVNTTLLSRLIRDFAGE